MITKTLYLSYDHLPDLDMDPERDFGDLNVEAHDYGYWVWMNPEDPADIDLINEWFKPIYAYARLNECQWVCFDSDAPRMNNFKSYAEE